MAELTPDQLAAHELLCELRTRIAVQELPYQFGIEARALESLVDLFKIARDAMKAHPGCQKFARETTTMLNVQLRPVTARWHRALEAGRLNSRDGADEFRADLRDVSRKLQTFAQALEVMAYGSSEPDELTPAAIEETKLQALFQPLAFGLNEADRRNPKAREMNAAEAAEIRERRSKGTAQSPTGDDAIGLALSGGGIRSATFCAGVLQVLANRNLLGDFDYLSTVSGGGYIGSFLTSWVDKTESFDPLIHPYGPDTDGFRHVRQHARFLSATELSSRWIMLVRTLAGMALNWSVPIAIIASLALVLTAIPATGYETKAIFAFVAASLGLTTVVVLFVYGFALRWDCYVDKAMFGLAALASGTVGATLLLLLEIGYDWLHEAPHALPAISLASLGVILPATVRFLPMFRSPFFKKTAAKVVLILSGFAAPALAVACLYLLRRIAAPNELEVSVAGLWIVGIVAVFTAVFAYFGLNINATSPHRLYRDALAAAFLHPEKIDERLESVNTAQVAPYHLINATVNLPASVSPVLKDRKGDFFLFSKHWSGSAATGYLPTGFWKINQRDVSLASAMAISGAAASPHMGLGSMPTLTALMTLLNIRLGVWMPSPKKKLLGTPGFACLLREMTGAGMTETGDWLNVTDGGHIENLGIYELLRRRCKMIVSIDGEADSQLMFQGNLTLVRHAQIDLGIRIEPRLDDIRLGENGFSRSHAQLFLINYPDEGTGRPAGIGLLLYLKLSLTGNEAELLKRYRILNPDFPHQSTADQFYDEEQFEAYRQLGVHVAEGMFSSALMTKNIQPKTVREWFEQLAANMIDPYTV